MSGSDFFNHQKEPKVATSDELATLRAEVQRLHVELDAWKECAEDYKTKCGAAESSLARVEAARAQMERERDSVRHFVENWCAIRNVSPWDTAAALRGDFAKLEACGPYLKDGETPAECIARNRADIDATLTLLAQEKQNTQALAAKVTALEAEIVQLEVELANKEAAQL